MGGLKRPVWMLVHIHECVLVCERGTIYWHCNAMLATGQHEREQVTESQIETLPSEEERGEMGWERDTDSE